MRPANSYVIAIGGTGARCLEALVHLCASGVGPKRLHVMIVDSDGANKNVEQTLNLIRTYRQCRELLGDTWDEAPFRTRIMVSMDNGKDKIAWSPTDGLAVDDLRSYFKLGTLEQGHKDLVRLLYADDELDLKWERGFGGRASVGAPVVARARERLDDQPWRDLIASMETAVTEGDARCFLFASLFGAMGASGVPAIGKLLRDKAARWASAGRLRLGAALLLPYFAFDPPDPSYTAVHATPETFVIKTLAALDYYGDAWRDQPLFDALYLVGDEVLESDDRPFGEGGARQQNPPHFVELLAAAAAALYCTDEESAKGSFYTARTVDRFTWLDVPRPLLPLALTTFVSTAVAFLTFYEPLLRKPDIEGLRRVMPWYAENFAPGQLTSDEAKTAQRLLGEYFTSALRWIWKLHASNPAVKVELLNSGVLIRLHDEDFKKCSDDDFGDLLVNHGQARYRGRSAFDELWESLCTSGRLPEARTPTGRFLGLLYSASRKFCQVHYGLAQEGVS